MISETVKNFIQKYNLSGTFVVAFSGGYDSMCLLDVLVNCGYDIVAVHLNHNWRGEESFAEAKVCEEFAKSRGIKFYSEMLPDDIPHCETAARDARYDFFKRCAEKFNSNVVFTAHNYDDNAETVLYRIIKGTGIVGLQGILEHRDIYYRPLLNVKRADIEAYCLAKGLKPNKDSSNEDIKYKRNLIRKQIFPLLQKINPNVIDAINSLSEIVKEDNAEKLAIRELLIKHNIDYDRKKIDGIYDFINLNKCSKAGKTLSLTNDLWLFANSEGIEVIGKNSKSDAEVTINGCGKYNFEDFVFSIEPFSDIVSSFPSDKDFTAYINTDNLDFTLRYRRNGDIIRPLGTSGSQKLKKYLNEKKIPNHKKDKIVLLCRENEVFWAAGLGLNDKIRVTYKPTHLIKLRRV